MKIQSLAIWFANAAFYILKPHSITALLDIRVGIMRKPIKKLLKTLVKQKWYLSLGPPNFQIE